MSVIIASNQKETVSLTIWLSAKNRNCVFKRFENSADMWVKFCEDTVILKKNWLIELIYASKYSLWSIVKILVNRCMDSP